MTLSIALTCLWAASTGLILIGPHRYHWPVAWGLICLGVPLVGWVTFQNGPILGLLTLLVGVVTLRLPMRGLLQSPGTIIPEHVAE
ncbi:MAG TPA: DUF2484 family protein [Paenirhodobacter sp.]